jgi:gliding motility-associated protein GldL
MNKFLQSTKGKVVMNFVYGFGAAIVILGAMFKIMHWPGASVMIVAGLTTEAIIFAISAFEPPHHELDWTLVYPELAMHGGEGDDHSGSGDHKSKKGGDGLSQELDKMLEEAKIGPELIESLGSGMRRLSESTSKLADMGDAGAATSDYVNNVKRASTTVSELSDSYIKAADALTGLSSADGSSYGEQLQRVSKNLEVLNSVYELQIQGSREYVESSAKAYSNIAELLSNLDSSLEDTKRYKTEIHTLSNNLSNLNTVYGNMLAAMNMNRA